MCRVEQNRRTNLLALSEDILVFSCKFWGQQCRVSLPECSNSTSHFVRHVINVDVEAFHKQETSCCHLSRMLLASWIHLGLASRHASTCCAAISAGRCSDSLPQHATVARTAGLHPQAPRGAAAAALWGGLLRLLVPCMQRAHSHRRRDHERTV